MSSVEHPVNINNPILKHIILFFFIPLILRREVFLCVKVYITIRTNAIDMSWNAYLGNARNTAISLLPADDRNQNHGANPFQDFIPIN
jgi:hypothetical protein